MRTLLVVVFLARAGTARADSSIVGAEPTRTKDPKLIAVEVLTLPRQATLRLVMSLDRYRGCSRSFDTIQQRLELLLEIKDDRVELHVSGTELHASGGRGINDTRPNRYRDETHPIGARLAGPVKRAGETLQADLELFVGSAEPKRIPITCHLERVGRDGSPAETVRALACRTEPDKPLRLGLLLDPFPKLYFGRGDGFAVQTTKHDGRDWTLKVVGAGGNRLQRDDGPVGRYDESHGETEAPRDLR